MARCAGKGCPINIGREDAGHVRVDAEQLRGGLQAHHIDDDRAPVAALCYEFRVPEALHQHHPGTGNVGRVPAGTGRLA